MFRARLAQFVDVGERRNQRSEIARRIQGRVLAGAAGQAAHCRVADLCRHEPTAAVSSVERWTANTGFINREAPTMTRRRSKMCMAGCKLDLAHLKRTLARHDAKPAALPFSLIVKLYLSQILPDSCMAAQ